MPPARPASIVGPRGARTQLADGVAFDIPLARTDTASYLGLNPDTLSRIMSRLRGGGIFSRDGRSQIMLRDFRALAALSPAAQALAEIHGDSIARPRRAGTMR
jgi:Crp-like helix-turn-helix domain